MTPLAPRLLDVPISGLYPIAVADANRFLTEVGHKLGPCNRPFRQEAYGLEVDGSLVAVAISASIVNGPVGGAYRKGGVDVVPFADRPEGFQRMEVVELARLAAANEWANRVMLRLWRELCAPRWASWPVLAAISYSHNAMHRGDLYRFDGWIRGRDDAGSSGGGSWSRKRYATEASHGRKSVWVWRYD